MQTINCKVLPATNTKPTRIKATAEGGFSHTISSWDGNIDEGYKKAALQLKRDKLGWTGKMIGGHTKNGMCFVFFNETYVIE